MPDIQKEIIIIPTTHITIESMYLPVRGIKPNDFKSARSHMDFISKQFHYKGVIAYHYTLKPSGIYIDNYISTNSHVLEIFTAFFEGVDDKLVEAQCNHSFIKEVMVDGTRRDYVYMNVKNGEVPEIGSPNQKYRFILNNW